MTTFIASVCNKNGLILYHASRRYQVEFYLEWVEEYHYDQQMNTEQYMHDILISIDSFQTFVNLNY